MGKNNLKIINASADLAHKIKQDMILLSLDDIARKAIDYALENKGYNNQTFNLHDSFGYAIFVNGQLYKDAIMQPMKAKVEDDRGGYGRDKGYEFLVEYTPKSKYEVVIVAGEFYAATLEVMYSLDVLTGAYQFTADYAKMAFKKIA